MITDNKIAFDAICGNCYDLNINEMTEKNVRDMASTWNQLGNTCRQGLIDSAIKGLREYQREV